MSVTRPRGRRPSLIGVAFEVAVQFGVLCPDYSHELRIPDNFRGKKVRRQMRAEVIDVPEGIARG